MVGCPHHITQRGNRRANVFLDDQDRRRYLSLLGDYAGRHGLAVWAYCLMSNHVHFVVVPENAASPARTFRDAHQAYAAWFNRKTRESGHLWQGRFFSCVLDDTHLWSAARYVARNPARAGLVERAEQYRWSSAAAHCGLQKDPLLSGDLEKADHVMDWREWLLDEDDSTVERIRRRTRTGRPCGAVGFVEHLEATLGRVLRPRKRGPKPNNERKHANKGICP